MEPPRRLPPAAVLVIGFAGAILLGALLLSLPRAAHGPQLSLLDTAFTATSAVCVTGLAVADTGAHFSRFGQLVLLLLMQAGGLGVMTFAIFVTLALGRRISVGDRLLIQDSMHHSPSAELRKLVRHVVVFALAVESVGSALLFPVFRRDHEPGEALFRSVFHAVSAFCNAGFALEASSLTRYRGDVWLNLVVSVLIVVGGIGFLVSYELRDRLLDRATGRRGRPLSLHARIVLRTTGGLLLLGFAGFLVLEWQNLLAGLPLAERLLAAWFQAVTPRTAGFNTVDFSGATAATLCLTLFLMFVGGSPGSTAGGVKTTALGLLLAHFQARWRGRGRTEIHERSVPRDVLDRVFAVTTLSAVLVALATFVLLISERGPLPHTTAARPEFLELLFEAVSAFGTVGLSTGLTPHLTAPGKFVVMLLMFVGRLGPLTVALAAGGRRAPGRFHHAEENVMVG